MSMAIDLPTASHDNHRVSCGRDRSKWLTTVDLTTLRMKCCTTGLARPQQPLVPLVCCAQGRDWDVVSCANRRHSPGANGRAAVLTKEACEGGMMSH